MNKININSILQRSLSQANEGLNKSLERLATGLRINNADDDAAGLALSTRINTKIRGLNQAQTNIQTGINVLAIADDSLNTIDSSLQKLKDLSIKAANGVYSDSERQALQAQADQLVDHIQQTKDSTKFNGIKLFGDSASQNAEITIQVGEASDSSSTITFDTSLDLTDVGVDLLSEGAARDSIDKIESILDDVHNKQAYIGAGSKILGSIVDSNDIKIENLSAAKSTIMDADIVQETLNLTKNQILADATNALIVQNNNNEYQLMKILMGF